MTGEYWKHVSINGKVWRNSVRVRRADAGYYTVSVDAGGFAAIPPLKLNKVATEHYLSNLTRNGYKRRT